MLILSRKLGEDVVIGNGEAAITIKVISIDRGRIQIGIQAPRDVPVMRAELMPNPYPMPPDYGGESG